MGQAINITTISDNGKEWSPIISLFEACHINQATWVSTHTLAEFIKNELHQDTIDLQLETGENLEKVPTDTLKEYPYHKLRISKYLAMRYLREVTEQVRTGDVPETANV